MPNTLFKQLFSRLSNNKIDISVLALLDFWAAFDKTDVNSLIERLEKWVGVCGSVLALFASHLKEQFSVSLGHFMSTKADIICGVPQGSILDQLLFSF